MLPWCNAQHACLLNMMVGVGIPQGALFGRLTLMVKTQCNPPGFTRFESSCRPFGQLAQSGSAAPRRGEGYRFKSCIAHNMCPSSKQDRMIGYEPIDAGSTPAGHTRKEKYNEDRNRN